MVKGKLIDNYSSIHSCSKWASSKIQNSIKSKCPKIYLVILQNKSLISLYMYYPKKEYLEQVVAALHSGVWTLWFKSNFISSINILTTHQRHKNEVPAFRLRVYANLITYQYKIS